MAKVLPTVLAVVAALLIAVALLSLSARNLRLAGVSFLGASLLIYAREAWATGG